MRLSSLYQLTLVKIRELGREPEALFWIFAFPVLLALALPIGVLPGEQAGWIRDVLDADQGLRAELLSLDVAERELRRGEVTLVVVPGDPWTYWYDPMRPESRLSRLAVDSVLQAAAGRADVHAVATREMTEKGSRYIDFLIPGLLGMNLMGTGMWGIGFYIVTARSRRLLKRMVATPMRKSEFLLAQIGGRLVFLVLEVGVLVAFAYWVLDVPLRGSLAALTLVCFLGAMTFCGLGLLVASRARTVEGVSGLMNVVMLPMWILSGTFFSTGRFPDAMQPLVQALPLTALNDALRAVMLDGSSMLSVSGELGIAAVWGVVSFAAALYLFRWT